MATKRHPRRVFAGKRVIDVLPVENTRDWDLREAGGRIGYVPSIAHAVSAIKTLTGAKVVKVTVPEEHRR